MRLKLLFFPLSVAISLLILIVYAWPELGKLRSGMKSLDENKKVLATAIQKNKNIENIKNELDQNQDKEAFVKSYLPPENEQAGISQQGRSGKYAE